MDLATTLLTVSYQDTTTTTDHMETEQLYVVLAVLVVALRGVVYLLANEDEEGQ